MATILIVDDEAPVRDFLTLLLESAGHRVVPATNGRQALNLIGQVRPDLVVSDVMMPVLDGLAFCLALKSDPATASIPVILMSAAVSQQMAEGATPEAYIGKPFSLDELEDLIDRWLGAGGSLSAPDPPRQFPSA